MFSTSEQLLDSMSSWKAVTKLGAVLFLFRMYTKCSAAIYLIVDSLESSWRCPISLHCIIKIGGSDESMDFIKNRRLQIWRGSNLLSIDVLDARRRSLYAEILRILICCILQSQTIWGCVLRPYLYVYRCCGAGNDGALFVKCLCSNFMIWHAATIK